MKDNWKSIAIAKDLAGKNSSDSYFDYFDLVSKIDTKYLLYKYLL